MAAEPILVTTNEQPETRFYEAPTFTFKSCVEFAKWTLGLQGTSWGIAKNILPNTREPQVGYLVLTNEGTSGHIAVIVAIVGDDLILLEANYKTGQRTTRILNKNSPLIRGYTKKTP